MADAKPSSYSAMAKAIDEGRSVIVNGELISNKTKLPGYKAPKKETEEVAPAPNGSGEGKPNGGTD